MAISESEAILSSSGASSVELDELRYLLGLSYLKSGNYVSAAKNFQAVLDNFKESGFKYEAGLGLADSCAFMGDFPKSEGILKEIAGRVPKSRSRPQALYRLSQLSKKSGDNAQSQMFLDILKREYPLSADLVSKKELYASVVLPKKEEVPALPEILTQKAEGVVIAPQQPVIAPLPPQPVVAAAPQQPVSIAVPPQPVAITVSQEPVTAAVTPQPVIAAIPQQAGNIQKPEEKPQAVPQAVVPEISAAPQAPQVVPVPQEIPPAEIFYSVQVGSFSNAENAKKFVQKLFDNGYAAYIDEAAAEGAVSYRVKIGKFPARQGAASLAEKLLKEGYSTRITP
jgi:DedD protein